MSMAAFRILILSPVFQRQLEAWPIVLLLTPQYLIKKSVLAHFWAWKFVYLPIQNVDACSGVGIRRPWHLVTRYAADLRDC